MPIKPLCVITVRMFDLKLNCSSNSVRRDLMQFHEASERGKDALCSSRDLLARPVFIDLAVFICQ